MTHKGTRTRRRFDLLVLLVLAALPAWGCIESGGSPVDPSQIPQVAGTYTGSITAVFPQKGTSLTCSATTTVTQSGATINVAPVVLGAACAGLEIPVGQAVITNTGSIPVTVSGSFTNPACGTYNFTVSGGFDGQTLQLSAVLTSPTCDHANLTLVMTRQ